MHKLKRIIDILMTAALMCLMAYQVTGEKSHEWIGILMIILVVIHQILNVKWYGALFKGKYSFHRKFSTIINIVLLISFTLTAISGMAMSNHAVPFLYSIISVNTARVMHLAFSYWSFIFMGLHIGLHISAMTSKMPKSVKVVLSIIMLLVAGFGFYIFIKSGIIDYITFTSHFAFLDYEKNAVIVFFENFAMLSFFVFTSHNLAEMVRSIKK